MEHEPIERNDEGTSEVRFASFTTEQANEESLRLGLALRNNTVVESISIENYVGSDGNQELVSDATPYLTDILYFLRRGPRLRHCSLLYLQSSWESILRAATSNPSVKKLDALGLDRSVDDLSLRYLEDLHLTFPSPQTWIIDVLHTARNLQKLSIRVMHDDPSTFVPLFKNLTSCPHVNTVCIESNEVMMKRDNGAYDMLYWIRKNCPLLNQLSLGYVTIDAEMCKLIGVPTLALDNCVLNGTPPPGTVHILTLQGVIRIESLGITGLLQSQLQSLRTLYWWGSSEGRCYDSAEAKLLVQAVLPKSKVLRSITIHYLEQEAVLALFRALPKYGVLESLSVAGAIDMTGDGFSRVVRDGLRGNGSLTLHCAVQLFPGLPRLAVQRSDTGRAVKRYGFRNRELPSVLRKQDVRSALVPSLLFAALQAPVTGNPLVAAFLWRYN